MYENKYFFLFRWLPSNFKKNKHIPWTGAFLTHHEKGKNLIYEIKQGESFS